MTARNIISVLVVAWLIGYVTVYMAWFLEVAIISAFAVALVAVVLKLVVTFRARIEIEEAPPVIAKADDQILLPANSSYRIANADYQLARQAIRSRRAELDAPMVIDQPPQLPPGDVLAEIDQYQRVMLLGSTGSGKSSLLRHLVAGKITKPGKVIICDPHGARPKWGPSIDAVGFGERWGEIADMCERLEWEHTKRIKQIERGHPERQFPIVTVVFEELQGIVEYFNTDGDFDIGRYIRMFLTRTRKTGIDIIVASQSKGVKATGLEGFSDNREGFQIVRLLGSDGRDHRVMIDDVEYPAPAYWPDTKPVGVQPGSILDLPVAPTEQERRILEMAAQGASRYAICNTVFGGRNEKYYRDIDVTMARFGQEIAGGNYAENHAK